MCIVYTIDCDIAGSVKKKLHLILTLKLRFNPHGTIFPAYM